MVDVNFTLEGNWMEELEDMFDVDLSRKRFLIYAIDRDVMSSSHIEFVSCN
jgi:hypothetical protein